MFVRVQARGDKSLVVPAWTTLSNDAVARGLHVFIEDPVALAGGEGRFEIELPNVDDSEQETGRAAVQALIDQIPNGSELFTIIERD